MFVLERQKQMSALQDLFVEIMEKQFAFADFIQILFGCSTVAVRRVNKVNNKAKLQ